MAKKETETPAAQVPAAYDWNQYQGATGLENLSSKDLGIPILQIIQKGSPEYDEEHVDHATKKIPGIKVGDVINSVSREVVSKDGQPVKVVPYFYSLVYVEWKPKAQGGGIVQTHTSDAILRNTQRDPMTGKDTLPGGNTVVTSAYFFVKVFIEGRDPEDALISMTSTQLKKSRLWLNIMKNYRDGAGNTLPMFHRAYFLTTIPESNAKGTWRGWKIEGAPQAIAEAELVQQLVASVQAASSNSAALIGNSPSREDEDIV